MKTNQLLSKATILNTFSTIRYVIDVSYEFNNNLTLISLNFRETFTVFVNLLGHTFIICKFFLPFLGLFMETNSFTRLRLRTPISNMKLKKWSPILPLYDKFARGVHSHTVRWYCDRETCHFH